MTQDDDNFGQLSLFDPSSCGDSAGRKARRVFHRVVVVGGDTLGRRIVAELNKLGVAVTALDDGIDLGFTEAARRLGAIPVKGETPDAELLNRSDLASARCLIAASDADGVNLEVALIARKLRPDLPILMRLSDSAAAARFERAFGIRSLDSAALAAPEFISAAIGGPLEACLNVEGMRIALYSADPEHTDATALSLDEDGLRSGGEDPQVWVECETQSTTHRHDKPRRARRPRRKVGDLWAATVRAWRLSPPVTRQVLFGTAAFAVLSMLVFWLFGGMTPLDAAYFVVTTVTTVGYGDLNLRESHPFLKFYGILMMLSGAGLLATVYAIVADRVLAARVDYLLGRNGVDRSGHTVVVGLGKVGLRVAMEIHALGLDVVAVELHGHSESVAAARERFPVVVGDGSRGDVLKLACVEHARAVIALTEDSVLNLDVALRARDSNPGICAVVRTHEPLLVERFKELGLDAVAGASALAAPVFAAAALDPHLVASFNVGPHALQLVRLASESDCGEGCVVLLKQAADGRFVRVDDTEKGLGACYALRLRPKDEV